MTASSLTQKPSPKTASVILPLILLVYMAVFNGALYTRLFYPPDSDQKMYLAGGHEFAHYFLFFWRSPLYGLWMGIFHILSGYDMERSFYIEKYVSTFLLGLMIACLGKYLFDTRTGLFMGIWALNCKYLVTETNGSHIIAAVLFTASLLMLLSPNRAARLPVALLFFLLSTQVRSEMWIPFAAVCLVLAIQTGKRIINKTENRISFDPSDRKYWAATSLIGIALFSLFWMRLTPPEPGRLAEAFAMNFAMNYIDRHQLRATTPGNELGWAAVWVKVLPGVSTSAEAIDEDRSDIHPFAAIKKYPGEITAHVVYNLKLFVRALLAVFLAFDRLLLMLVVTLLYLLSYRFWRPTGNDYLHKWRSLSEEQKQLLVIWSLAIVLLIPISFVLRVVARYYLQLLPVLIGMVIFGLRWAMNRISRQPVLPKAQVAGQA